MKDPVVPRPADIEGDAKAIKKILSDAQKGLESAKQPLRDLFDQYPDVALHAGDLARRAETALLRASFADNFLEEEGTRRWLADRRQKLTQPGDGELERLLIERLVLCEAAVDLAEIRRAEKWKKSPTYSELTFWDRHASILHGDFLKASRALADNRRLARPTVLAQMNIADKQQINISLEGEPLRPDPTKSIENAVPPSPGEGQGPKAPRRRTALRET